MDSILYIDDENANLKIFKEGFKEDFILHLANSTNEAEEILRRNEIKVVITDQRMPVETGIEFIKRIYCRYPNAIYMILSGYEDFYVAKLAIETGMVYRFLLKPWKREELIIDINNAIDKYNYKSINNKLFFDLHNRNKELVKLKQELEDENSYLKEKVELSSSFDSIITNNKAFLTILNDVEQIANSDASVLIYGETGTGKELIAKAIHNSSNRKFKPFISINCAAIPETLFESELFGHEKGAYTGATCIRKGKFELANGGTLFLDEIGEIPLNLQVKLLRAIQNCEIQRLGSEDVISLDVRIVSATNKNLKHEIEQKTFRADLFFRINVFLLQIPPLRERRDDIPLLIHFFINKYCSKYGKRLKFFSKKNMQILLAYSWTGNIRELENIIERAVVISSNNKLELRNFEELMPQAIKATSTKLKDVERCHIIKILEQTSWKISGINSASELLDLPRTTLLSKMKKLGIEKK